MSRVWEARKPSSFSAWRITGISTDTIVYESIYTRGCSNDFRLGM